MRKLCAAFMALSTFFIFCGCAYFSREASPQNIYKSYIAVGDPDGVYDSPSEYISETQSGAVVSIVATYYVYSGGTRERRNVYSSGIVLNAEGYILTTASASVIQVDSTEYEAASIRAVLAPVYEDDTLYTIKEVDRDEESGLALYRFYDDFYYPNEEGATETGLQFTATLSTESVSVGDSCWLVGNNLGDVFGVSYDLNMLGGIVSDAATDGNIFDLTYNNENYNYLLAAVPATPEMQGGGLFDKNGYIIGLFASKVVSETNGSYEYLSKSSLFYKTDIMIEYVNDVSEKLQTVIPLSVAQKEAVA